MCDCYNKKHISTTTHSTPEKLDSMHLSHFTNKYISMSQNSFPMLCVGQDAMKMATKWRTIETHAKNFAGNFTQFVHIFIQFFTRNLSLGQVNVELTTNKCKKFIS